MDPFTLQKQIKDNVEDLHTYLRDLNNWETDIKKKDAELRGVDINDKPYPDIRSKAAKTKKYEVKKLSETKNSPKNPRISGFDYASWDKLDVDKVCDDIDTSEAQRVREAAIYEKERGNAYVKGGNWEKAITCYSKAIKSCPNDAVFFANRALCYLKIKDFQKAECDCTKAIELDPEYVKAWLRRYAAREGLGKMELAKRDLLKVLSLEPHNTEARTKLIALNKCLNTQEEEKCHERIVEVEHTVQEKPFVTEGSPISDGTCAQEVSIRDEGELNLPWKADMGEIIMPIQKAPHLRSKKPLRRVPVVEECGNVLEPGGGDTLVNRCQTAEDVPHTRTPTIPCVQSEESTEIPEPAPSEIPPVPKSSVQFLLAWKTLKMHPELAIRYLQKISPESLPHIFGDSLDISTLEEMLNIMGQNAWKYTPAEETLLPKRYSTYEFLMYISCVPRFSTLTMFLTSDEKMITRQLLASCVKNGECSTEEAADVAFKFKL